MSTAYVTVAGDTFESVARKTYGTGQEANRIAKANPGVLEPLASGLTLNVPELPGAPANRPQQTPSENEDEVAILINAERFRFWENASISLSMDSIDTVSLTAPFDPVIPEQRDIFRPMSFSTLDVTVGGTPLFTGTMVDISSPLSGSKRVVNVSGYSTPGVMSDCTMPASAFPLEFNGQGLTEIAETLSAPFGVNVNFETNQGAVFERVALSPASKILPFLVGLAKQRNLVFTNNSKGDLVFSSPSPIGTPVANLRQGEQPLMEVTPSFSPQEYYSDITGLEPVSVGTEGSQFTVKNPRLTGVIRPFTFTANDTNGADIKTAVESKASRMFANMVSYEITVNTWRTSNGELWTPNTTLILNAPGAMIYRDYEFLIRSVRFDKTKSLKTATLNLVLPGAFEGILPEVLPWDE